MTTISNYKSVTVKINDLIFDEKTNDTYREKSITEYSYDASTHLNVLISDLVGTKPVWTNHIFYTTVQYIIKNSRVEWHVPTDECTVDEYLLTYPNETLELIVVGGIGADIPGIIQWIFDIIGYLISIEWLSKKISKYRVKRYCRSLIGKDNRYIESSDLTSLILSRSEWKLNEFMKLCGFWDETLSRCILYYCGYECDEDDLFKYSPELASHNAEQLANYQKRNGD